MLSCGLTSLPSEVKSTARVSLAEVFHPWVRWEGPGSGFESSPAAASGNLGICPLGIEVEKHVLRTAWLTTCQQFQGVVLKLKALILNVRESSSHVYQKNMIVAV